MKDLLGCQSQSVKLLILFYICASFSQQALAQQAMHTPFAYHTSWLTAKPESKADWARLSVERGFKAAIAPNFQRVGTRLFYVDDYGAKGDGSTNSTPGIIKAVKALNANGGKGRLVFGSGTYLVSLGTVAVDDTSYMTLSDTTYFVFNITGDNSAVELQPDTIIKVVTSVLCQNAASQFSSCYQVLFGSTSNPNAKFRFYGNGGKITFATAFEESGSGVTRVAVLNGNNGFWFFRGKFRDMIQRDYETTNFPANMALDDGYTSGGNVYTDSQFYNIRWVNYGGSGHDSNSYFQGGNLIEDVYISSDRAYHSHSFYFGAGKPNNKLNRVKVAWTGPNASLSNKYGIQSYSEGANADVADVTVENSEFTGMIAGMLFQHANISVTGKVVRRIKIINTYMYGDGTNIGLAMTDPNNCEIRGSRFENWSGAIQFANASAGSTTGQSNIVSGNTFSSVGGAISSASNQTSTTFENNTLTSPTGSGYLIISSGKSARHLNNHYINCAGSSRVLMNVSGDDLLLQGNEIRDSSNYGGQIIYLASGAGWKMIGNTISTGTGGYVEVHGSDFLVSGNTINQRFIVFSDVSGANLISSNVFGGTAGKLEARGLVTVVDNKCPNGPYTASGSDAAGFRNSTGNEWDSSGKKDTVIASGTSFTPHAGLYVTFVYTLTGTATIANPEGANTDGRIIHFQIVQDATGSRALSWGSIYRLSCSGLSGAAANSVGTISFKYDTALTKYVQLSECKTGL